MLRKKGVLKLLPILKKLKKIHLSLCSTTFFQGEFSPIIHGGRGVRYWKATSVEEERKKELKSVLDQHTSITWPLLMQIISMFHVHVCYDYFILFPLDTWHDMSGIVWWHDMMTWWHDDTCVVCYSLTVKEYKPLPNILGDLFLSRAGLVGGLGLEIVFWVLSTGCGRLGIML